MKYAKGSLTDWNQSVTLTTAPVRTFDLAVGFRGWPGFI